MHFHFNFSADDILWTLTFAALLVLLVVLLGRDRVKQFKWFTTSLMLMALSMLMGKLLFGRMPPIVSSEIFLVLADATAIVAILVVVEMARRAFPAPAALHGLRPPDSAGCRRRGDSRMGPLALGEDTPGRLDPLRLAGDAALCAEDEPPRRCADHPARLADCALWQALQGRMAHAHVQQIVIGLSTASMTQLAVRIIWQQIALHTTIHTQAEYQHVMDLQEKFYNANRVVYLAAMVWWRMVCLWIDEPGSKAADGAAEEPSSEAEPETPVEDGGAAG